MDFPDTFTRHDLHGLRAPHQANAANALGLPWFAAFLDSVDRCQATPPGRLVRRYLLDLLAAGSFAIRSPVTGRVLRSGASVLLVDKSVLFSFPEEPEIMLGVGDISLGYPVCALVMVATALFIPLADRLWGFTERHLPWAAAAIRDTGWSIAPRRGKLTLVVGDTNFAHHAWNQLSALHDVTGIVSRTGEGIEVVATQQPLGPIHAILPDLPPWPVRMLPDTSLQALNRPGLTFAPIGAHLLTRGVCERIHASARTRLSGPARTIDAALAAAPGPVLWISVRTRNRTAVNQHAMLDALGRRFLDRAPGGTVLIDSFSVADDLDAYPDYQRAEASAVLEADRDAADRLLRALDAHAPGRTLAATGLTVGDGIALARHADIYFCHHGTVQHKIGWFTDAPGVVHCNPAMLATTPAPWVAAQSELARLPVYLPVALVAELDGDAEGAHVHAALLRHENYRFTDIEAAVAVVLELAEAEGLLTRPRPAHT